MKIENWYMGLFFKKRRRRSRDLDELFKRRAFEGREVYTKEPKFTFKKPVSFWERIIFILITIVLAGAIFYFLFISRYFEITDVAVTGVRESIIENIEDEVEEKVEGMRIKNIFLFRASKTEKELEKKFYLLKSVRVCRKLPGIIKIEASEKEPVAIIHSGQHYFFLDADSFAFEEVSLTRLAVTALPIIENKGSNKKIEIGDKVLSPRFMDFVLKLQEVLPAETELEIIEISIPAFASREVHVRVKDNILIYFDIQRTVESQVLALKKTLAEVITQEEREQLQYIDLRVENKVFYYPSFTEEEERLKE